MRENEGKSRMTEFKSKIPYYPYSLIIIPVIIGIVSFLLFFIFKDATLEKLQSIKNQLSNLEKRLGRKEKELSEDVS